MNAGGSFGNIAERLRERLGKGGENPSEEGLLPPFPKPHPLLSSDFRVYRIPLGRFSRTDEACGKRNHNGNTVEKQ